MKVRSALSLKTIFLLFIIQVQLSSQNVGIGTNTPSAKLHLKSTVQSVSSLDLDFETGTIDPANTSGNYDWYITGTDGSNSAKSAKAPLMFNAQEKALLSYSFNMSVGKEITVSFDYKYDDPTNLVDLSISTDGFLLTPPTNSDWRFFSTTYVSESTSDLLNIGVKALQDEAFPIVHIDNIMITYDDGHVLKIEDGTEEDGNFLQSDALGQTEWFDLRGEFDQKLSDNLQNLDFDTTQNTLFIEDGNGVLISSLKNNDGKSLQLTGSEIKGSPGMSLHLPSSTTDNSSFYFDAVNNTMDWGIYNNVTKGLHSTRWGFDTKATNIYATAWGYGSLASGIGSTSFGIYNTSSGNYSNSWGNGNFASGLRSTSWGRFNEATAENSTSFGYLNHSTGELTTTWGQGNNAVDARSTAWGQNNQATSYNDTAWGSGNLTDGPGATAWGSGNTATEQQSTVWGVSNDVSAKYGTACGHSNLAEGYMSFVSGFNNIVNSYSEVSFGRYNNSPIGNPDFWNTSDLLFSIGNGSSDTDRNNAFSVGKNGRVAINSLPSVHDLHIFDTNLTSLNIECQSGDSRLYLKGAEGSRIQFGSGIWTFDVDYDIATNCLSFDDVLRIDGNNVGIDKLNPSFDLHLGDDDAAKPGSSSWTVSSDRRLKKDITPFTDGLDIISAIEPVWFTYNGLADIPESTYVGTIAQELEEIAPYMVSEYTHRDDEGNSENYKAVNYGAMDFVLINAIKEQQLEIVALKAQIAEIMALLASQKNE